MKCNSMNILRFSIAIGACLLLGVSTFGQNQTKNSHQNSNNSDQISKQAREVREQTMRHAGNLEKLKKNADFSQHLTNGANFKTTQQKLELAMKDLRQRQLKRVERLTQEVDDLLNKIKELGKQPPEATQNISKTDSNHGVESGNLATDSKSPDQISQQIPVQSSQDQADNRNTEQLILNKKPVDEIALANNLVAIGSYDTAIKLLRKILKSKNKKLTVKQKNWLIYQLGVCYRARGLYDEALRQFRIAANSKVSDISTSMAKWWIGQIDSQQKITNARKQIQAQIESAGE